MLPHERESNSRFSTFRQNFEYSENIHQYSENIQNKYLHLPRNPEISILNSKAITNGRKGVRSQPNSEATLTALHLQTDCFLLLKQISAEPWSSKYSVDTKSDSLLSK